MLAMSSIAWASPASAAICDAAAFSCPNSGTCVITGTWDVGAGCALDFGSRAVEVRGTLQAETRSGAFEIRTGDLTLNGGKLRSLGNTYAPGGAITVVLDGGFTMRGSGPRIDTSGNGGGGPITVSASTIDLQTGVIVADGGTGEDCGQGGLVWLEAFSGPLSASAMIKSTTSGDFCEGGEVALTGASVQISGDVDAHGAAGASDHAIVVVATASDITISGSSVLNASGVGQPFGYGSDGGHVVLDAPLGNVVAAGASITAWGKSPYGSGGAFLVGGQDVTISSRVTLQGGSNGVGGEVSVEAYDQLTVDGEIIATGGSSAPDGLGGTVDLLSNGPLIVSSTIDASALTGGAIWAWSNDAGISISGRLIAHGSRWSGGSIELSACTSVGVTGTLDAAGSNGGTGGYIDVEGESIAIGYDAHLLSSPCTTADCISFLTSGTPPTTDPHAEISPPAEFSPEFPGC
jgi:hypothetical protein